MLLIVNADDLGASEPVNEAIFSLMDAGLVKSATLMTNAPGFQRAAQRLCDFPRCSFGVHLNLTAFAPLSGPQGLEAVLDADGRFSKRLLETPIPARLRGALLRELRAQVQRALDAGVPVSHFDSHHHMHTIPALFPVLKSLQREFEIRKVRSTINLLPEGGRMGALRRLKKGLFNFALRNVYATSSPRGLGNFRDFHALLSAQRAPRLESLELMVHPGTGTPHYEQEVAQLKSGWRAWLSPGTVLGSYLEL
jgi:chitin disaccharide deacetylase